MDGRVGGDEGRKVGEKGIHTEREKKRRKVGRE